MAGPFNISTSQLGSIDISNPVNVEHPLNQGRVAWWKVLPQFNVGNQWFDLMRMNNGTLTNMGNTNNGFRPNAPPGGWGSVLVGSSGNPNINLGSPFTNYLGAFTFGGWFKFLALPGASHQTNFMGWGTNTIASNGVLLEINSSNAWQVQKNASGVAGGATVSLNTWYRVIYAWNGTFNFFYINGVNVTNGTGGINPGSGSALMVGNPAVFDSTAGNFYCDDLFFSAMVWNASTVAADYTLSQQGYPGILNRSSSTTTFLPIYTTPKPNTLSTYGDFAASKTIQGSIDISCPVNMEHPLNQGRVAWWKVLPQFNVGNKWFDLMGKNPGTLTNMGNTNNGFRPNAPPGGYGSILLDGTAGYISSTSIMRYLPVLTNYSFAISLNMPNTAVGNSRSLIANNDLAANYAFFVLAGNSNLLQFEYADGSGSPSATTISTIAPNKWYRLLITANVNIGWTFYVNGQKVNSLAHVFSSTTPIAASFAIGSENDGNSLFYPGYVDDFSLWYNRVLTAQDAADDYNLSVRGYPGVLNRSNPTYFLPPPSLPLGGVICNNKFQSSIAGSIDISNPVNVEHPLNQGRVAWWKVLPQFNVGNQWFDLMRMNNGTLTNMGNTNNGFRPNAPPGGYGSVLFDGTAGYVLCPTLIGPTSGFSFAAWVQPSNTTTTYIISSQYSTSSPNATYFQFFLTTGGILHGRIQQSRDTIYIGRTGSGITTGMQRVMMTWNGGTSSSAISLYCNGIQIDSSNDSLGSFTAPNSTPIPLRLGAQGNGAGVNAWFSGYGDDFTMWSRGLSSAEATLDYNLSKQGYPGILNRSNPSYFVNPQNISAEQPIKFFPPPHMSLFE